MTGSDKDIHAVRSPAVRWFFRLHGAENPALEAQELREWERVASRPLYRREFVEVNELWKAAQKLGGPSMPSEAELAADDFDGTISVVEWLAQRKGNPSVASKPPRHPIRWLLLAASLATLAVASILALRTGTTSAQIEEVSTSVGQQRELRLVDGSILTLGARTQIQTRITAQERVILLERGEAWFKVAREKARPFKVLAGEGVITALGTEFNVRRDHDTNTDRVTVTVGAGAVRVEPLDAIGPSSSMPTQGRFIARRNEWNTARLEKGQELTYGYGASGTIVGVKRADIEAAAAWKEGRLEYIHQPLSEVVARVNRYSEKPIVLADDSVGQIDFSGTVFERQIPEWIRALQRAFPISVDENAERILLRAD